MLLHGQSSGIIITLSKTNEYIQLIWFDREIAAFICKHKQCSKICATMRTQFCVQTTIYK